MRAGLRESWRRVLPEEGRMETRLLATQRASVKGSTNSAGRTEEPAMKTSPLPRASMVPSWLSLRGGISGL